MSHDGLFIVTDAEELRVIRLALDAYRFPDWHEDEDIEIAESILKRIENKA